MTELTNETVLSHQAYIIYLGRGGGGGGGRGRSGRVIILRGSFLSNFGTLIESDSSIGLYGRSNGDVSGLGGLSKSSDSSASSFSCNYKELQIIAEPFRI